MTLWTAALSRPDHFCRQLNKLPCLTGIQELEFDFSFYFPHGFIALMKEHTCMRLCQPELMRKSLGSVFVHARTLPREASTRFSAYRRRRQRERHQAFVRRDGEPDRRRCDRDWPAQPMDDVAGIGQFHLVGRLTKRGGVRDSD